VDQQDRELPAGETGEVAVDGPTVMSGYLDMVADPRKHCEAVGCHTGDLGRFDAAGNLSAGRRARDVVITGGYNVYPREVEQVLLDDPSIGDVGRDRIPDPGVGRASRRVRSRRSRRP